MKQLCGWSLQQEEEKANIFSSRHSPSGNRFKNTVNQCHTCQQKTEILFFTLKEKFKSPPAASIICSTQSFGAHKLVNLQSLLSGFVCWHGVNMNKIYRINVSY